MKQENKKLSAYKRIVRGLYTQVDEGEKKARQKIVYTALATLLVASLLLFTAALMETGSGKYVYVYGEQEQKISADQAIYDGEIMIDFNALANYCQMSKEIENGQAVYSINGTKAEFENGNDVAIINGISHKMPSKAAIKNGYCLIPLSTVKDLFLGVNISQKNKTVSISLDGKNVYILLKNPKIEYNSDISDYIEHIKSPDEYSFTLVNKQNPVDRTFPEDKDSLWEIPAKYRKSDTIYLYKTALYALQAMMNDMFALGFDDVFVTSAYRRYDKQEQLFEGYVQKLVDKGMSYDEAYAEVLKDTALPGESEHQTGLCIDFMTRSMSALDNSFAETEVFEWLVDNAWKYGFVLRYPEDKTNITGYSYESWHYRFVGLERASVIYQTGICYEEYLEIFGGK